MLEQIFVPSAPLGIEVRLLVALAFTAAAAYFDVFNKKWVPNYLVYGFLAAALALNLIFFSANVLLQGAVFCVVVFLVTYPLYKIGQLGGADVYILAGIALAVPYLPLPLLVAQQPAPYPFLLSVLAPTGLAFILHMLSRFLPYIFNSLSQGKIRLTPKKLAAPLLLAAVFLFFIYAASSLPVAFPPSYALILSFLFASLFFFTLFKDEIKESMVELLPASSLQEEDVLALEAMDKGLVSRLKLSPLLTKNSIAAIKKARLKKVPVYTKMPFFLPYLFLGLLFAALFGDIFSYLISGWMPAI
jgi:hypothetical protein